MPGADQLLNTAVITALGWTLVHFLWQGCVIALVYWLICVLAPRYAAALRYWAGLTGMLLSLMVMLLTFTLTYAPEARFGLETLSAKAVNPFLVLSGSLPDVWLLLESGIEPVLPWVVVLWMIGVATVSTRTLGDWIAVRKLMREGLVSTEVQLQIALENIKAKLGVQLAVRLLASSRVAVPMVVGCLRPVILIPVSVLARLPQDQLEMILAHELGHVRRFDYAFNLLQVVMETLLFYHPAITWMSQRVREEREHCCDDLVVRECGRPATYARALTNLEVLRSPALAAAVPATGGNLLARIRLIIDDHSPGKNSGLVQLALAAIAGLVVAMGAQQGYSLSSELNRVAFSVQLQASDVQWKTWGHSREVWGEGINLYAQDQRKKKLAALKVETISVRSLAERDFVPEPLASVDEKVPRDIELHSPDLAIDIDLKTLSSEPLISAIPLLLMPRLETLEYSHGIDSLAISTAVPAALSQGKDGFEPAVAQSSTATSGEVLNTVKSRPPNYPWRARRKGIEGFIELEFGLNEEGEVIDVEVLKAIPEGFFEKAATNALSRWTFEEPANGDSRYRQTFDFGLQDLPREPIRKRTCALTGSRTCSQIAPGVFVVLVNAATRSEKRFARN